jgi:hypothetical protein
MCSDPQNSHIAHDYDPSDDSLHIGCLNIQSLNADNITKPLLAEFISEQRYDFFGLTETWTEILIITLHDGPINHYMAISTSLATISPTHIKPITITAKELQ